MSIDVGAAKIRAGQLEQYSIWLKKAKAKMLEYKSQINDNWSGKEVTHINLAIDQGCCPNLKYHSGRGD